MCSLRSRTAVRLSSWALRRSFASSLGLRPTLRGASPAAPCALTLGVQRSFSRPHVSDDNAFSEAQFKTLKYQPDYPGRFASELHARGWLAPFFGWHNDEHHHSNLALFTPADVFFGRVEQVRIVRQSALDAAHLAHPERFPHGAPHVLLPPSEVSINPLTSSAVTVDDSSATSQSARLAS